MSVLAAIVGSEWSLESARAKVQAIMQPFKVEIDRIAKRAYAWQADQNRRGVDITGAVPREADEAIFKQRAQMSEALRNHYASHTSAKDAERKSRIETIRPKYRELAALMGDLEQFDLGCLAFARECGMPHEGRPLNDPAISSTTFRHWEARVDAVLNPPVHQQPVKRAPATPFTVD